MKKIFALFLILISSGLLRITIAQSNNFEIPNLKLEDTEIIEEAFNLLQTRGDSVWPGWSKVYVPFIYKKKDFEYWINFPDSISEGKPIGLIGDMKVYGQKSDGRGVAAGKDVKNIHSVVMSSPELIGMSKEAWVITTLHEMFHIFQYSRGYLDEVNKLNLSYGEDASWMLEFPFPYQDSSLKIITHNQGYLASKINNSNDFGEIMYDCFMLKDNINLYKTYLAEKYEGNKNYWYSVFQQTTEGTAKYAELKIAEIASKNYTPKSKSFNFKDNYSNQINVVRHAGKGTEGRLTFYYLGLGKCLVLDKINPNWKNDYFTDYWLDLILINSLNKLMQEME